MNFLKSAAYDLWYLFFPNLCVLCNEHLIAGEQQLCIRCLAELPQIHYQQSTNNALVQKLFGRFQFESAHAGYYFNTDSKIQHLIHEIKYRNNQNLAIYLGKLLASKSAGNFKEIDMMVPVPLSPKRQFERGYNQSALLAEGISASTGIAKNELIVKRIKNTESQTRKSRMERIDNMIDAFEWNVPKEVFGKHILMVDDVLTTGATMESLICAAPKEAKLKFSILCFAHASNS